MMAGRTTCLSSRCLFSTTRNRGSTSSVVEGENRNFEERSTVTRMLWDMRNRDIERLNPEGLAKEVGREILEKSPSDSFTEVVLPFSKDESLREQYISPFGHVRIGRLLEDLDALAGNVAFHHCDDNNPRTR